MTAQPEIRRFVLLVLVGFGLARAGGEAAAQSWIFLPSTYSHDPSGEQRVAQYVAERPSYAPYDPNYMVSGYRHIRSSIRDADGNYDQMHVVETWGAGEWIRPYGEWLYPFRAGATPYGPWGNPQGPWTLPFDSWVNPYGRWNRWPYWGSPYLGQPLGGLGYPSLDGLPPGAGLYGPGAAPYGPGMGVPGMGAPGMGLPGGGLPGMGVPGGAPSGFGGGAGPGNAPPSP